MATASLGRCVTILLSCFHLHSIRLEDICRVEHDLIQVQAISLDFLGVPGSALGCATAKLIAKHGFPKDKRLGAGVIDGRSVWSDGGSAAALVAAILGQVHCCITCDLMQGLLMVGSATECDARARCCYLTTSFEKCWMLQAPVCACLAFKLLGCSQPDCGIKVFGMHFGRL